MVDKRYSIHEKEIVIYRNVGSGMAIEKIIPFTDKEELKEFERSLKIKRNLNQEEKVMLENIDKLKELEKIKLIERVLEREIPDYDEIKGEKRRNLIYILKNYNESNKRDIVGLTVKKYSTNRDSVNYGLRYIKNRTRMWKLGVPEFIEYLFNLIEKEE